MTEYIPYTYLLYCKPTNQYYYGVKYGTSSGEANPEYFFKTYFTSSIIIKELINLYGVESFEFEIRKTFKDAFSAMKWEKKVLTRIDAMNRDDFINQCNGCVYTTRGTNSGKKMYYDTELNRYKLLIPKDVPCDKRYIQQGQPKSNETKRKMANSHKGKKKTPEHQAKLTKSLTEHARKTRLGKTFEEIYGEEKARLIKQKQKKHTSRIIIRLNSKVKRTKKY